MVRLFLVEAAPDHCADGDAAKKVTSLLDKLESIVSSVITSGGGRYQARLWFCNAVSCIHSISPSDQRDLFIGLLRSKPAKQDVAAQLLRLIFEKRPERVGAVIAKRIYLLEKFFEGNPKRILHWFDHFAGAGEMGHKKGARALSQFAFVNRDICWEELEWKGKHGQSPAVVATKPHYFQDLDVLQTVENFLEYVPDFWSSDELAESVKDGDILRIDTKYFVDLFLSFMFEDDLEDIWTVINEFLKEEQFSFLSQHLLIMLDENGLFTFLKAINVILTAKVQCNDFKHPSYWLENVLCKCINFTTLDELYVLNALINQGRQIVRLMLEEEPEEEKNKLEELLPALSFSNADHWSLMRECIKMNQKLAVKLIGLHTWALHYCLSKRCRTRESCESLFTENGISFRNANEYSLLRSDASVVGYGGDTDGGGLIGHGHRKRKRDRKRRRRRRNYSPDEGNADDLLEFETSDGWQDKDLGCGWLLSTDNYSCTWHIADLPEYLSRHCFITWMKWISSKQYPDDSVGS